MPGRTLHGFGADSVRHLTDDCNGLCEIKHDFLTYGLTITASLFLIPISLTIPPVDGLPWAHLAIIWKAACFTSHNVARSEIDPGLETTSMAQKPSELRNLYGRPAAAFSKNTALCRNVYEPSMNWPCCRGPKLTARARSGMISRASIQLSDFTSRPYLFPSHIAGGLAAEILCDWLDDNIASGKKLGANRGGLTSYVEAVEG